LSEVDGVEFSDIPKMKRIASLDFQRGLAIWMMVFLHSVQHLYDISWATNVDTLMQENVLVIVSVLLLALFSGFAGYFLLISAIVNSLAMTKRAARDFSPVKIMLKQIITGLGLLIAGAITEGLLYYGYLGQSIRGSYTYGIDAFRVTSSTVWDQFGRAFFTMETLQAIGWCMIINGIIHYFLMIKKGYEKQDRNIVIYAVLTFAIIASSYFVWVGVDNYLVNTKGFAAWPNEFVANDHPTMLTYVLTVFTGDLEPLFPFLATSFIGSIVGLVLSKPKVNRKFPRHLGFATLFFFALGGIVLAIGEITGDPLIRFDFTWFRPNLSYFLILNGIWLGLIALLLRLVEFRAKGEEFATSRAGRYFRLWGIIALSVFSLQIYSMLPKWLFSFLVPENLLIDKLPKYSEGYVILLSLMIVAAYDLMIRLWSKVNFKFSFEWFILRASSKGSGYPISQRLNTKRILDETEWINYVTKEEIEARKTKRKMKD
jgi:hypothetical protein